MSEKDPAGYRDSAHVIEGCNIVVLDVDGGTPLAAAQICLAKYQYYIYTTKRHTPEYNRYRVVMPLSHVMHLSEEEYKLFYNNILDWVPFTCDNTGQRSRKWLSNASATHLFNKGEPLDVQLFIPDTAKQKELKSNIIQAGDMSRVERWFVTNTAQGNRSNQLYRYAMMLIEQGLQEVVICSNVEAMNLKFSVPISETELHKTVFISIAKKVAENEVTARMKREMEGKNNE